MNAVSENIFHEMDFFAVSFLLGILLILAYDCLRIFRRLVRHGTAWVSLEDFVYWIAAAFVIFAMLYQKNDGLIRGFSLGGIVLGMLLYNQLASRYVVKYAVRLLERIIQLVGRIARFVSTPFRKASGFIFRKSRRMADRQRKFLKYVRKRLKKIGNEVKMGISKK